MTDLFGGAPPPAPAPPARRARAPREKAAPAEPKTANLPTCAKSQTGAPGPTSPPEKINTVGRQYGLKTLHDGRQVDSGSADWRMECLASTLLLLGGAEREAWILGYGTPEDRVELRLRVGAVKASGRE